MIEYSYSMLGCEADPLSSVDCHELTHTMVFTGNQGTQPA